MVANLIITGSPEHAVFASYLIVFEPTEALEYMDSTIHVDTMERCDGAWKVVLHESTLDPPTVKGFEASCQATSGFNSTGWVNTVDQAADRSSVNGLLATFFP